MENQTEIESFDEDVLDEETPVVKERLLPFDEVEQRTGVKKSTAYAKMKKGLFPKPIKISARSVRWVERDIDCWIEEQISASL